MGFFSFLCWTGASPLLIHDSTVHLCRYNNNNSNFKKEQTLEFRLHQKLTFQCLLTVSAEEGIKRRVGGWKEEAREFVSQDVADLYLGQARSLQRRQNEGTRPSLGEGRAATEHTAVDSHEGAQSTPKNLRSLSFWRTLTCFCLKKPRMEITSYCWTFRSRAVSVQSFVLKWF